MCLHRLAIHFLLVVQVAEAIQCRGMQNRLADSIQVMANLLHPCCIVVRWCQHFVSDKFLELAVCATCLELNALLITIVIVNNHSNHNNHNSDNNDSNDNNKY